MDGSQSSKSPSPTTLSPPPSGLSHVYLNVASASPGINEVGSFSHIPKKRISTISEDHTCEKDSSDEDIDEDDEEYEDTSDEEEEEDHLHPIKMRYKPNQGNLTHHLTTIMGYCGLVNSTSLTEAAMKSPEIPIHC